MKKQLPYFIQMMHLNKAFPLDHYLINKQPSHTITFPMAYPALRKKVGSVGPVSNEVFHILEQGFHELALSMNQILISAEQVPDRIFFITHGLLRGYYIGEKERVTTWFAGPNEFLIPNNYFSQEPCNEYIESLEDCTLLSLNHETCVRMCTESNDIAKLFFKLMEQKQINSDLREKMLRLPNAEMRYHNLMKLLPFLHQNVKDDLLASYMNVTRRHLERLKIKATRN